MTTSNSLTIGDKAVIFAKNYFCLFDNIIHFSISLCSESELVSMPNPDCEESDCIENP